MAATGNQPSEQSPLLASAEDVRHRGSASSSAATSKPSWRRYLVVVAPCFIFYFAMAVLVDLFNTAADQISERIICQQIYDNVTDPLQDPLCKDPVVQSELSLITGLENTFELIPSILSVIPYGIAADKFGRKPILVLTTFGNLLPFVASYGIFCFPQTLSVRWRWGAVLLNLIGGGQSVFDAVVYSMVSDATPVAMRSTLFFWLSSAPLLGHLVGGPVTYLSMERGEWFTVELSIVLHFAVFVASIFVKETLKPHGSPTEEAESPPKRSFIDSIKGPVASTASSIRTLFWGNKKLSILFFVMFFSSIGRFLSKILLRQYIAKRFDFSWATANLMNTIVYAVQLGLVIVILPAIGSILLRAKFSPVHKDAWIARGSFLLAVAGNVLVGLASTVPVLVIALVTFAASNGFDPAMRSLLVSVAAATGSGTGAVMSTIGLMQSLGLFISGPIMAASFRVALRMGEFWLGLPFFIAAVLMALASIVMCALRFTDMEAKQAEVVESQDELDA